MPRLVVRRGSRPRPRGRTGGLAPATAQAATAALSEQTLLSRLDDPTAQLTTLPAGVSVTQLSSHDMTGGNEDGGSYDPTVGKTALPPTFVRMEAGGYVLADELGPGCLVRIWMTGDTNGTQGDPGSFGNLQMFFDGSSTPAVNEPVDQFFDGKDPRFPAPLVNGYLTSSGGNYSYVPFCFAHRLEIRVTGALTTSENYFQLTFLHARPGTPVDSFDGDGAATAEAAAHTLRRSARLQPARRRGASRRPSAPAERWPCRRSRAAAPFGTSGSRSSRSTSRRSTPSRSGSPSTAARSRR